MPYADAAKAREAKRLSARRRRAKSGSGPAVDPVEPGAGVANQVTADLGRLWVSLLASDIALDEKIRLAAPLARILLQALEFCDIANRVRRLEDTVLGERTCARKSNPWNVA